MGKNADRERSEMMEIIKESDFRKEIKSNPRNCYLFFGEEDYMKSFALKLAVETISPEPSFSFFNEIRLDALSYSPDTLLDSMMPLPMMAERKIIVISGLDVGAMRSDEVDALCTTLAKLEDFDYNTVIISVASDRLDPGILPKKPSATLKKFGECAVLVNFEKNSPAKLAAWVGKHFEHNGVSATPDVCSFVIERCGRDMFILAGETDKLAFYVKQNGRSAVTREDVIGVATPAAEYDAFAFTNAIGARRKEEALSILRELKMKKTDPIIIMGEVTKTLCDMTSVATLNADGLTTGEISSILKIHEFRVSLILKNRPRADLCKILLSRCREADLELKSTRDGYAVLEKLICTI